MIRKRKKSSRKKGKMSHASAKHRGSGNRGGVGRAGRGKKGSQRMTKYLAKGKRMGKYGFKNPVKKKTKIINLGELMKQVKEKEVKTDRKVLGKGEALPNIKVTAKAFSKKAKEKIEKAKGQAVIK